MRVESNPLALKACPEAGSGVHRWILHAGNWCLAEGKSDAEAIEFIRERITRKPSPRDEIETGISKIYNEEREPGEPYVPVPRVPEFGPERRAAVIAQYPRAYRQIAAGSRSLSRAHRLKPSLSSTGFSPAIR